MALHKARPRNLVDEQEPLLAAHNPDKKDAIPSIPIISSDSDRIKSGSGKPGKHVDVESASDYAVDVQPPSFFESQAFQAVLWGTTNLLSSVGIVFVNKIVMQTYAFRFPVSLTWIHTLFTVVGLQSMAYAGLFKVKKLELSKSMPLALCYVGYIVLANLSLQLNPVSLYQILKIATTPCVVLIELLMYSMVPSARILVTLIVLVIGVSMSTVTELNVSTSAAGLTAGIASTITSSMYQVWASRKQREFDVDGMQLLHQCTPPALVVLGVLAPFLESVHDVTTYPYDPVNVFWIVVSSIMGIIVTLSAFLMIGCTSSLTYNVIGQSKSVLVLAGGFLLFGELCTVNKALGLTLTLLGVSWYTYLKVTKEKGPMLLCCDCL